MKKITLFVVALLCVVAGWAQETVTVPESATVEDYTLSYTDIDYNDNQTNYTDQCKVAFDGNDIYLSGLGFSADIWVKGTLNGSTLTVAKMQLAGKANNKNYYLAGRTSEHGGLEDIVFTYIEESGVLYCEHEILAVDANDYVGGRMMNVIYTPGTSQGSVDGLPEGAQVYNYTFRLTEVTDQNMEDLTQTQTSDYTGRVAFYGQDVYVQGLGYQETSWIKGTLSGETITFPSRQVGGSYGGQDLYLIGYNGQETSIVFHYDEATGTMTLGDMYVFLINGSDNVLGAVTYAVLFRQGGEAPIEDEVVTPPANINPQPYIFKGKKMLYDQDGAYQGTEDAAWNIKVAWSGANEVYVQGLCSAMPEAWVKGTVDDDEVTFAKGQYFGKQLYPFYFSGQFVGEMSDFHPRILWRWLLHDDQLLEDCNRTLRGLCRRHLRTRRSGRYADGSAGGFVQTARRGLRRQRQPADDDHALRRAEQCPAHRQGVLRSHQEICRPRRAAGVHQGRLSQYSAGDDDGALRLH